METNTMKFHCWSDFEGSQPVCGWYLNTWKRTPNLITKSASVQRGEYGWVVETLIQSPTGDASDSYNQHYPFGDDYYGARQLIQQLANEARLLLNHYGYDVAYDDDAYSLLILNMEGASTR
jgi:hypothetical protein